MHTGRFDDAIVAPAGYRGRQNGALLRLPTMVLDLSPHKAQRRLQVPALTGRKSTKRQTWAETGARIACP